jgi:uncharacterized damage-inducible protein DinB
MDRSLLVAHLEAAPNLLRLLGEDFSPDLAVKPPRSGEWSVTEVVRHFVEGERDTFLPRLRRMLAEERPVFPVRDRQASADRSDLATLLGAFESARGEVIKILNGLEAPQWAREGVSPSRGAVSVEAYAATMAGHDTEHLQQIHQVRSALGLRPKRTEARVALPLAEVAAAIQPLPGKIEALSRGLSAEQLRQRPREGEWSMKEVMAHFLKVERDVFLLRLQRIVNEDRPRFESFDPEAWAAERDHRQGDFMDDWRRFAEVRRETATLLTSHPPAAADRIGLSAYFGPVTLAQYATHIVDHDAEHLAQLQACRAIVSR